MLPTYEEIQGRLAVYEKKYRMAIRASCEYRNDLLHQGRLADASFNFTQKSLAPCIIKLNEIRKRLCPNDYSAHVNNRILQKHSRVSYAIDAVEIIIKDMSRDSWEVINRRTDAYSYAAMRFEFYRIKIERMKKKVDELQNRLRVKQAFSRIKAKRRHDKQYATRF